MPISLGCYQILSKKKTQVRPRLAKQTNYISIDDLGSFSYAEIKCSAIKVQQKITTDICSECIKNLKENSGAIHHEIFEICRKRSFRSLKN